MVTAIQEGPGWLPAERPLLRSYVSGSAEWIATAGQGTARQGSLCGRSRQRLRSLQSRLTTLTGTCSASTPRNTPSPVPTSYPGKVLPLQSSRRGSERESYLLSVTQHSKEKGTVELGSPGQPQPNSGYFSVSMPTPGPRLSPPSTKATPEGSGARVRRNLLLLRAIPGDSE